MAVAGLRKASGPDAYLTENHSLVSRRCVNNERLTTRTSSIRKMWRDLESEGSVKENGKQQMNGVLAGLESPCSTSLESMESLETSTDANEIENECPRNQIEVQIGQEDDKASCVQRSPFDVPEKDRVRKIFHEWGSNGFGGRTRMNNGSRAQRIGENECKRVKIVRGWIESSSQQGDTCRGSLEEPASEIGSPIARTQDGTVDSGTGARSSIRRIFGRQALIDLLKKFQREREREVEGLLENHFVSNFAHRHRIQSSLKGRFLRSQRFVEVEKQSSVAASDLGLLRKTHAVADIRKEFLSKLNNNDHVAEGAQSDFDTSSANDLHIHTGEAEVVQEKPHEIGEEIETTNLNCDPKSLNPQGVSPVGERHDAQFDSDADTPSDNDTRYDLIEEAGEIVEEMPNGSDEESDTPNLSRDLEAPNLHKFVSLQEREKPPLTVEFTETVSQDHDSVERNQSNHNMELSQGTSGTEFPEDEALTEVDKVMLNQFQSNKPSVSLPLLKTSADSFNWQEASTQAEEWQDSVTEYEDDDGDDGWYQETIRSDFQESLEESYDNVEDTTESWFGGTSYLEAALAGRSNSFYSPEDGNGSRVELRELTSRRRVSNLLQSDFGARLDLLMQSYVDRQDRVSRSENGWMQSLDENAGGIEAVDATEGAHPSTLVMTQTQGNNDLHGATDVRIPVIHQHLGTEREIINGLRNDLNTLHERMNDMQRMLESCMDVQLELQRSVQQEVYSALNQSINSGACEDGIYDDHSGSSPAKEGVCFSCCDNGLESLPDRSVHMYICSKCAEKINWSKLKESARHSQV